MKASDADLDAMNGKVVLTMELAMKYGFTDLAGELPSGPFSDEAFAESCRVAMSGTPVQYDPNGSLADTADTNSTDMAAMLPGA